MVFSWLSTSLCGSGGESGRAGRDDHAVEINRVELHGLTLLRGLDYLTGAHEHHDMTGIH
jgi:hypothetical protein